MPTNPYNISLSIFRNRSWVQTVVLSEDVSEDSFALVVLPVLSGGGAIPAMAVTNPAIASGSGSCSVTFVAEDTQTGELTCGSEYQWQCLWLPNGAQGSTVVGAGPLVVNDSPPFPTENV
jgi:hypothetical protein